jgi:ubiquinone/menaquinone biosynthesis C-methylase UbiE
MPILRVDNYIDAYRLRAHADDIHEMAARPDKRALTEFVNRRILEMIQPDENDCLVDIGCGDASLLRMMAGRTASSIGIVSTADEKQRLEDEFPALSIKAGDARSLPLDAACASKIVCNAVFMYLGSESDVKAAVDEIARIARPGAIIWIGEVPEIDEYEFYGMYRGHSMPAFLWHLLRQSGLRSSLGMIRRWLKAVLGKEQIVLNSAGMFYGSPEKLLQLGGTAGLKLKTYFRHKELGLQGQIVDSQFRYDYLFTV